MAAEHGSQSGGLQVLVAAQAIGEQGHRDREHLSVTSENNGTRFGPGDSERFCNLLGRGICPGAVRRFGVRKVQTTMFLAVWWLSSDHKKASICEAFLVSGGLRVVMPAWMRKARVQCFEVGGRFNAFDAPR